MLELTFVDVSALSAPVRAGAEHWYRFEDRRYAPPLDEYDQPIGSASREIARCDFPVMRHTPKGAWLYAWSGPRFVLREVRKRFACPTVEEALASYIARKERQIRIKRAELEGAEEFLRLALRQQEKARA